MSSQMYLSEKAQCHIQCDSGFESSSTSCSEFTSMKVSQADPISDHVKDLQAEFTAINDFDAVTPNDSSHSWTIAARFNINVAGDNNQVTNVQQFLRYFEQDEDGDTQLHIAIYNHENVNSELNKVALWLIDNAPHSSLLDIKNDECLTALHYAVMSKQYSVVRRLVLAGANTTIVTLRLYTPWTSRGNAALHMACEADDLECVKVLTEPLNEDEYKWLARHQRMPPILGRDLEERNCNGVTPMHVAIRKGNLEIMKQLIKVGAKVNTDDPCSGLTSFHLAIDNEHRHIVEYMATQYPECINVPTRFGLYAYEIAFNVDKQLAEDLVRLGAKPVVQESDSDYSETDSDECLDDESANYSPSLTCSDLYQGSVATATLIVT